jgi:hypothetical protein
VEAALNAATASIHAAAEAVATEDCASGAAVAAALGEAQDGWLEANVRVKFCLLASPQMIPEVGRAWLRSSSSSGSSNSISISISISSLSSTAQ